MPRVSAGNAAGLKGYRGHEYTTHTAWPGKVVLEIIVNDDSAPSNSSARLLTCARTGPEGNIGDGKIFVLPADQAIQIIDGAGQPGAV